MVADMPRLSRRVFAFRRGRGAENNSAYCARRPGRYPHNQSSFGICERSITSLTTNRLCLSAATRIISRPFSPSPGMRRAKCAV